MMKLTQNDETIFELKEFDGREECAHALVCLMQAMCSIMLSIMVGEGLTDVEAMKKCLKNMITSYDSDGYVEKWYKAFKEVKAK